MTLQISPTIDALNCLLSLYLGVRLWRAAKLDPTSKSLKWFAFTYGFLTGRPPQECVDLGVAHGALLMSTRGDTSQITLDELMHIAGGGSARIKR